MIFLFFDLFVRSENHTILSQVCMRIHHKIIVNAPVLSIIIKTISHTSSFPNITKIFKKVLQNVNITHIHTQLHKLAFIPIYFSNKSTKTTFGLIVPDNVNE